MQIGFVEPQESQVSHRILSTKGLQQENKDLTGIFFLFCMKSSMTHSQYKIK